ncbi:unnamed protein product [Arctia plantaginis]|uniref:Crossover junction endonuclease MUS81 n=1 Tax=Arctia plantaginis TaxID=874455 RepID=A0A8S1AGQ7_ARCPL|nr:unnamed protein product [Arctia plantaginis]
MEPSNNEGKRITYKRARPNPLFQEWLEELYEEAKEKKSKLESMLKEALGSLSKYPLPLKSGAECAILKGFGKKLCAHLDQRLEVYRYNLASVQSFETGSGTSSESSGRNSNCSSPLSDIINVERRVKQYKLSHNTSTEAGISNCKLLQNTSTEASISNRSPIKNHNVVIDGDSNVKSTLSPNTDRSSESQNPSTQKNKHQAKAKKYKPAHRSGAYAILIALLEHCKENPSENSLTKEELINKAQKHSEESFLRPKPNCFYTAWSNMSRLVNKGLITQIRHKKVRYFLSREGTELAEELLEDTRNTPTVNDIIFNSVPSTSTVRSEDIHGNEAMPTSSENNNISAIVLLPFTFDIILLIDKNETGGTSKKNDPTVAQFNKYPDLKHEYRSLKVGDYAWIARHKVNKEQELVLPLIVERKRMDDLGASIKDGRFHEQKFRLRKCGLKSVVYMVENYGINKNVGLPIQNLMQALANTRVQDDFQVHITHSLTDSAKFLTMMTNRLAARYQDRSLKGCSSEATEGYLMTFEYFNKASAKTKPLTVTETFIKLLLQLKGVSVEKALAITSKFNTPRSLIIQYKKCDRNEGEFLLANIKYGNSGRNVGPSVSKSIYLLFSKIGE